MDVIRNTHLSSSSFFSCSFPAKHASLSDFGDKCDGVGKGLLCPSKLSPQRSYFFMALLCAMKKPSFHTLKVVAPDLL